MQIAKQQLLSSNADCWKIESERPKQAIEVVQFVFGEGFGGGAGLVFVDVSLLVSELGRRLIRNL
jgi:hypothetical protein